MNQHEVDGKLDKIKGKMKVKVGDALNDQALKTEGKTEKALGKMEVEVGEAERKATKKIAKLSKH